MGRLAASDGLKTKSNMIDEKYPIIRRKKGREERKQFVGRRVLRA